MKKVCFFLSAICFGSMAYAQQAKPKQDTSIILALPADAPTVAKLKVRLVELALVNPSLQAIGYRAEAAKHETTRAKAGWLNMFTAAGNLNEYTIKGGTASNSLLFPRYNFGLLVPLGSFISIPAEVKAAKANRKYYEKEKENGGLEIKAKVLSAYEEYAANKQLLELHLPLLEDAFTYYKQIEAKFTKGEADATVDIYSAAYRVYNTEMVRKITLERELKQSKFALEAIIGVTLEEVLLTLK